MLTKGKGMAKNFIMILQIQLTLLYSYFLFRPEAQKLYIQPPGYLLMSFTHFFYIEISLATNFKWEQGFGTHLHPTNYRHFFNQRCVSWCYTGRKQDLYSDPQSSPMYSEVRSTGTGAQWNPLSEPFRWEGNLHSTKAACRNMEHIGKAGNTARETQE